MKTLQVKIILKKERTKKNQIFQLNYFLQNKKSFYPKKLKERIFKQFKRFFNLKTLSNSKNWVFITKRNASFLCH